MALAMRNTFKSYDRLKNSGMSEAQARGIVEAIEDSADFSFKELVTKSDLLVTQSGLRTEMANLRTELKAEIAEVRTELKADIAEVRAEVAEVKTEVVALKVEFRTEITSIKSSIRSLQAMFISGFFVIIAGMALSFFHH